MAEIKTVIVPEQDFEVWSEDEQTFIFNTPSNFFVMIATGDRVFYLTKNRELAQKQANLDWGDNKYRINLVKETKTKSKLESGGLSCYGTATRAKGTSKPPK